MACMADVIANMEWVKIHTMPCQKQSKGGLGRSVTKRLFGCYPSLSIEFTTKIQIPCNHIFHCLF